MKTYTLTLKGTKSRGTRNITTSVIAENKNQAYNFACIYFEFGSLPENLGTYIPDFANFKDAKGKYFVPRSALTCN